MDREHFYATMNGEGTLDYELYLNTKTLLSCQKDFAAFCNGDELQFQVVHQVEELWMKLIGYSLLDIDDYMQQESTNRVVSLFRRVHIALRLMIEQLSLLETMSPKEYQEIRLQLGNGSGQESPGFRSIMKMPAHIWQSFQTCYLDRHALTIDKIYNSGYTHSNAYVVAEAMVEFDELFQRFRYCHVQLIGRTIGLEAKSLKGRSVERLIESHRTPLFPALWSIRSQMTDQWGGQYGVVRDSIGAH